MIKYFMSVLYESTVVQ